MDENELLKEKFKTAVSSAAKAISEKLDIEVNFGNNNLSKENSNIYHHRMPTEISDIGNFDEIIHIKEKGKHKNRHYFTKKLKISGDAVDSRRLLLFNEDLLIYKLNINKSMDCVYRNSHFEVKILAVKRSFISK